MFLKYLSKLKKKRFTLPLIGVVGLVWFEEVRNYTYFPLVIGFASFIFFWNFPYFVYKSISKPLYYEDLFLDEKKIPCYDVDNNIKNRFKNILKWLLIITNTILTSVLSDYYLYKNYNLKEDIFQLLGITGGLIKLFELINNLICKYILKIMRYFILLENKKINESKERIKKLKLEQNIKLFENLNFDIENNIDRISFELDKNNINTRERLNTI